MTTFTLDQISLVLSDIMHDTVNHHPRLKTNSLLRNTKKLKKDHIVKKALKLEKKN